MTLSLHSHHWRGACIPLRLGRASVHCRGYRPALARTWGSARRCRATSGRQLRCRATSTAEELDAGLEEAINEACNKCLRAMLAGDEAAAGQVSRELQELQQSVAGEGEEQAAHFLGVLRSLLRHSLPTAAGARLEGAYQVAIGRLCNQLSGSDWKLVEEGKESAAPGSGEPTFATWEEVLGKKKAGGAQQRGQQQGQQRGKQAASGQHSAPAGRAGHPVDSSYYQLLGVFPTATAAEIKSAYRRLALKLHPDISDAPDANERFAAVAQAYDTLSDETSRTLYDQYGPEGMSRYAGAGGGGGNARRAWEEFKPHKRENKHTRARVAARASYGESFDEGDAATGPPGGSSGYSSGSSSEAFVGSGSGGAKAGEEQLLVVGAVVEYPLGAVVKDDLMDGRTHGVALLVGRNMDRGDAARLPAEVLDLCELEPLRQEEAGSDRWVPDELSPPAFCRLGQLRQVPVASFDARFDVWRITAPLSEGCGGPELPEEVIV